MSLLQVRKLAKSEDAAVAAAAVDVVEAWKTSVKREQATPDSNSLKRASTGLSASMHAGPPVCCLAPSAGLHALGCHQEQIVYHDAAGADGLGAEGLTVRTHSQPARQNGAEEQQQAAEAPPTPGSAKGGPQPAASPRAFSPRGRTSGSWTPSARLCVSSLS